MTIILTYEAKNRPWWINEFRLTCSILFSHETHKIGVLYIGPGQEDDESGILLNEFGSCRYMQFLHGLGALISLKDIDKTATYLGGLDYSDGDGDFTYMWEDDVLQVLHVFKH